MPLHLVHYGHPALRSKGKKIEKVDANIREFADQMIQTMYDFDGCGLAAQQVGRSLQIAVIDVVEGMKKRPSKAWQNGKPLAIESIMPLVLINPEIIPLTQKISYDWEACISIPEVYAKVRRPARIKIRYQSLEENWIEIEAEGLLARAAMHEVDHLHGILFIDHLFPQELAEHEPILKRLAQRNAL